MRYYAVFDTNVLISSLLTKKPGTATGEVIDLIADGVITPVFNDDILAEYEEVLRRTKFSFSEQASQNMLRMFRALWENIDPLAGNAAFFADEDDRVFFEVTMAKRSETTKDEDAYLITGNLRHFPVEPFIVTPAEMLSIIRKTAQQDC